MDEKVARAVRIFRDRQLGPTYGPARWINNSRWFASEGEWQECCPFPEPEGRAWPRATYWHCCTMHHIARLCKVNFHELRTAIQEY